MNAVYFSYLFYVEMEQVRLHTSYCALIARPPLSFVTTAPNGEQGASQLPTTAAHQPTEMPTAPPVYAQAVCAVWASRLLQAVASARPFLRAHPPPPTPPTPYPVPFLGGKNGAIGNR